MIETKSCAMVAGTVFAYTKIDNDQFITLGVKCFLLPQTESVKVNVFAGLKFFHAETAAKIVQHIDEAGILTRWIGFDNYAKMKRNAKGGICRGG